MKVMEQGYILQLSWVGLTAAETDLCCKLTSYFLIMVAKAACVLQVTAVEAGQSTSFSADTASAATDKRKDWQCRCVKLNP